MVLKVLYDPFYYSVKYFTVLMMDFYYSAGYFRRVGFYIKLA